MVIYIIIILISIIIFATRLRISNSMFKIESALNITFHLDGIQSLWNNQMSSRCDCCIFCEKSVDVKILYFVFNDTCTSHYSARVQEFILSIIILVKEYYTTIPRRGGE